MILEILVGLLITERVIWYLYFNDEILGKLELYREAILRLKKSITELESEVKDGS